MHTSKKYNEQHIIKFCLLIFYGDEYKQHFQMFKDETLK